MSQSDLSKVVHRAIEDEQFLARLEEEAADVFDDYDLTAEEEEAIVSGDEGKIRELMRDSQPARRQHTNCALNSQYKKEAGD